MTELYYTQASKVVVSRGRGILHVLKKVGDNGSPNLLDVLTDYVTLDQKTINRIEDLKRAERRWMAHHKSGEVLRDEVESVRSRLGVILTRLFDEGDSDPSITTK